MSNEDVLNFDLDSDNAGLPAKREKLTLKEGRTYRLSLSNWSGICEGTPDWSKAPIMSRVYRIFVDKVGHIRTDKEGTGFAFTGKTPKCHVATIVTVWPTNPKGEPDPARLQDMSECQVVPWIFSVDKYEQIASFHRELGLGEYDLKVTCTDEKFQKLQFAPAKGNLLRKISESKPEKFKELVAKIADAVRNLPDDLGSKKTPEEVRAKMAGATPGATSGSAAASASASEVDDLVGSIL